jgi:hypothetical protein
MISVSPARRRAEGFAALVDGGSGLGDSRDDALLDLVAELRAVPAVTPRPEFVADLRAQLLAAADEALVATEQRLTLPAHPRTRRDRRIALAAGTLALVGGTASVAVASQGALPGDALYPIKRVLESTRTSLEANDTARAEQILDHASSRLDEARALAQRDDADSRSAIPDTLDDFVTQANQAAGGLLEEYAESGDTTRIDDLRSFADVSLDELAALKTLLPADFADELDAATNALLSIDARAVEACPECGGLLDIPAILASAPTSEDQLPPVVEPRRYIVSNDEGGQTAPAEDPVQDLIRQLPLVGNQTPGGTQTPGSGTGLPDQPPLDDPTGPLDGVIGGLTGQDGEILTGTDALSGLLDPLLGAIPTDDGTDGLLP